MRHQSRLSIVHIMNTKRIVVLGLNQFLQYKIFLVQSCAQE